MTKKKKTIFLFDEIEKIEHVGMRQCYDLGIPKNHNFFANEILVHNTGELEQVADVVILLHWPYHHDNEKPKNQYLINIAKNRDGRTGKRICQFIPEWGKIIDEPPLY